MSKIWSINDVEMNNDLPMSMTSKVTNRTIRFSIKDYLIDTATVVFNYKPGKIDIEKNVIKVLKEKGKI